MGGPIPVPHRGAATMRNGKLGLKCIEAGTRKWEKFAKVFKKVYERTIDIRYEIRYKHIHQRSKHSIEIVFVDYCN